MTFDELVADIAGGPKRDVLIISSPRVRGRILFAMLEKRLAGHITRSVRANGLERHDLAGGTTIRFAITGVDLRGRAADLVVVDTGRARPQLLAALKLITASHDGGRIEELAW